jgi:RNA polymerase sigma-70 factor, ECF subfamily
MAVAAVSPLHLRFAPRRASRLDPARARGQVWLPVGGEVLQLRAPDARFAAFAREHRPLLLATARRLTGSDHDAHDLVQDTLERALRRFAQLPAGGNPRGWVFTILHNAFIDRCRSDRGQRATQVEQIAERLAAPDAEAPAAWEQVTPEQVKEAVARLPEEFRAVYDLHAEERKSYEEISRALGIPKATVGTRLMRARRRLKELLLGEDGGESGRGGNGASGGRGGGHGDA